MMLNRFVASRRSFCLTLPFCPLSFGPFERILLANAKQLSRAIRCLAGFVGHLGAAMANGPRPLRRTMPPKFHVCKRGTIGGCRRPPNGVRATGHYGESRSHALDGAMPALRSDNLVTVWVTRRVGGRTDGRGSAVLWCPNGVAMIKGRLTQVTKTVKPRPTNIDGMVALPFTGMRPATRSLTTNVSLPPRHLAMGRQAALVTASWTAWLA